MAELKETRFFALALLLAAVFSLLSFSVGAFEVNLELPEANASLVAGETNFVFNSSGKSPLSCELLFDGTAFSTNITAYKNLPLVVKAEAPSGAKSWSVRCADANGETAASEERPLYSVDSEVPAGASAEAYASVASIEASPSAALINVTSLSGFIVTGGGEREESALMPSWRTSPGRSVTLAALFSNGEANAVKVSLAVSIANVDETMHSEPELLKSAEIEVAPGESRALQVTWVPRKTGSFAAEGKAVSGSGEEFGNSVLRLNVEQPPNADWFFLLAIVCVAALCLAIFKTRANAAAIRGGGLNK